MSRRISANRLLKFAGKELGRIDLLMPAITQKDSFDDIIVGVKVILEQLRSVLDYLGQDITDLATRPTGFVYFPFIHPLDRNGIARSPHAIEDRFTRDYSHLGSLATTHPALYSQIKSLQGVQWLSDMISAVNPQKHDDLADAGEPIVRAAPNVTIQGAGARIRHEKGAIINGVVMQETEEFVIGEPIPESLRHMLYESVDVDENKFRKEWIDKLKDWTEKTKALVADLYQHIP